MHTLAQGMLLTCVNLVSHSTSQTGEGIPPNMINFISAHVYIQVHVTVYTCVNNIMYMYVCLHMYMYMCVNVYVLTVFTDHQLPA